MLPSTSMPMLAAVTPENTNIKIIYEAVEKIPFEEDWDLVGITGMGSGTVRAWQIADEFREKGPKVVIGGVGPSLFRPELTLQHADSIVIGEAEKLWPEVIEDFSAGRLKEIYQMSSPPDITDLPTPRYDLMNMKKMGFMLGVQATRGCPFNCQFCSATAFSKGQYRKRPIEKVIQDVRAVKRTGHRFIIFLDDNICADFDYSQALWEALIPEKILWISSCSLHITERPDLLELAYRSGCRLLSYGLESLASESLRFVDKDWNDPQRYKDAIQMTRKYGILAATSVMIGMDGDTPSTFQQVHEFTLENRIPMPRVMIFTPIPGTPLYEKMEDEKRIIDRDYSKYSGGVVVFKPKNMSPEELQEGFWRLYDELFSVRNIRKRLSSNLAILNPVMKIGLIGANILYRKHIKQRIVPGIT